MISLIFYKIDQYLLPWFSVHQVSVSISLPTFYCAFLLQLNWFFMNFDVCYFVFFRFKNVSLWVDLFSFYFSSSFSYLCWGLLGVHCIFWSRLRFLMRCKTLKLNVIQEFHWDWCRKGCQKSIFHLNSQ